MATGKFHKPVAKDWEKRDCEACQRKTWHVHSVLPNGSHVWTCGCSADKAKAAVADAVFDPAKAALMEQKIAGKQHMDMSMWDRAKQRKQSQVKIEAPWAAGLFPAEEEKPATPTLKLKCSFCGVEVDAVRATSEKRPRIRVQQEPYLDSAGEIQFKQTVSSVAETVHACPGCCLQIRKPIEARIV